MPIFQPTKNKQFLSPFGPSIGFFQMDKTLVNQLNSILDKRLDELSEVKNKNNTNVIRKIRNNETKELKFDDKVISIIGNNLKFFLLEYFMFMETRRLLKNEYQPNNNYNFEIKTGWFVRQFENEYNPVHFHEDCRLSCVGYLKLPKNIEEEWNEDWKDSLASNGHIQFIHGSKSDTDLTLMRVKPQIGDFYVFPSSLLHTVYPFYTSGERRSFSMNINFFKA